MKRLISFLLCLTVGAVHAAAPTLVDYVESNWTDTSATSETAASISWEAGDVIYVIAALEQGGENFNAPTVTGLSFSSVANIGDGSSNSRVQVWEATAGSSGSGSITANKATGTPTIQAGLAVYQFRGVDSRSSVASTLGGNNKVISLAVEQDDAHVIFAMMDWNAVNDTSVSPTPSGGTQRRANYATDAYTAFVFDWSEQAAGTRNYGITDHTGTVKTAGIAFAVYGEGEPSEGDPEITSVTPSAFEDQESGIVIAGENFGSTDGDVLICPTDDVEDVDCEEQTVTAWADDEITFTAEQGELTGGQTLYLFVVTDDAKSNAEGYEVEFVEDVVATKLIFGSQPGNIIVGQTFPTFTVRAVDDDDNLDEDFIGNVTLTLQTGDGTLGGTLTKAAVAGVATFDDVYLNTLNTGAVIRASASGLTSADSDAFDVTAGTGGGGVFFHPLGGGPIKR